MLVKLKRKYPLTETEKDDMRNQRQAAFDKMTPEQQRATLMDQNRDDRQTWFERQR